ncbi:uncharacterized protein Dana_GF27411 [Drosophila ananassae]|uniref:MD-2-related lipid-recognition domain-containing protein n=1 Tax=Drosophila ananassae TaxID=7217 RepID=A0A0P8YPQ8_DROAN|nr:uncharacterized protein Dana_GF27411 [Drosophila ananassae]
MRLSFIICFFLGIFLSTFTDAFVFKFTNFNCKSYNESWFVFHECRLKAVSRDRIVFNMNGSILHPAYRIKMHYQVLKKENGYKPWLINGALDACRFIRNKYDPFGRVVYGLFQEFSNINHTCPYMGPQILKNFYLRYDKLMLPFPTGDYLLALRWHFDEKLQFDTNASVAIVEDLFQKKS